MGDAGGGKRRRKRRAKEEKMGTERMPLAVDYPTCRVIASLTQTLSRVTVHQNLGVPPKLGGLILVI